MFTVLSVNHTSFVQSNKGNISVFANLTKETLMSVNLTKETLVFVQSNKGNISVCVIRAGLKIVGPSAGFFEILHEDISAGKSTCFN